jgi:hypothetical protein
VKPLERDPATPPASQEPPAPQEVFAKLHLQVLVYSEAPSGRLVFINNQKYVEGQRIDANLVIERITSDGVFVSYQGKRVLLRADHRRNRGSLARYWSASAMSMTRSGSGSTSSTSATTRTGCAT